MATVVLPEALRPEAGGAARLPVPGGATLRSVLDTMGQRWPRLERRVRDEAGELRRYLNVYIDGEDVRRLAGQDTPVSDHAEVRIIPSVAGG